MTNANNVLISPLIIWDRVSFTCGKNVWKRTWEKERKSLVRWEIMKIRHNGKEDVFCFILSKNISSLWDLMMSVWYEKTKSIWTNRKHPSTITGSFKKNGMVPATTSEELDKVLSEHPEIKEIFIDWTERPIQRSSNYESQEKDYSWKKKRHTQKNIVVTWDNKMIIGVWKTMWWKNHDYPMLKESWFMEVLVWCALWVDLWFQGIEKDFPHHNVNIPKKNYKKRPLTQDEKDKNRIIASVRVIVENIFGRAKKYRIIANRYRNRIRWNFKTVKTNRKHIVMLIVCWLYNLWKSNLFIS